MYAYAGNNPVMNIDPNSDFAISIFIGSIIIGTNVGTTAGGLCLTGGMKSVFSNLQQIYLHFQHLERQ